MTVSAGERRAPISISVGSRNTHAARRSISGGKVAEKSSVCRSLGIFSTIRRTSGRKPMSSIRSTSSSTRIFISFETHCALFEQIEQPSRGGDENIHAALQCITLFAVTDAAMHESALANL